MRTAGLILGLCSVLCATPALSVSDAQVSRFVRLSDQFNAKLSRSEVAGLDGAQRAVRGKCILETLEQKHGAPAVSAVMALMQTLAGGAEFDDPTVVEFNDRYGDAYNAATRTCLSLARNS